jgi:hypothetical protein
MKQQDLAALKMCSGNRRYSIVTVGTEELEKQLLQG